MNSTNTNVSAFPKTNRDNRQWTADEIARAQLTEPPSPSSYTSPAGAYILDLYSRHIHHVDTKFDFHLPRFSPDRD